MISTVQSLIDAARTLVDDDHNETSGWIKSSTWIQFLNWEYQSLYRRLLRLSLIQVAPTDLPFTGTNQVVPSAIAIVGVAEDKGSYARVLLPYQGVNGPASKMLGSTEASSPNGSTGLYWNGTGASDFVYITIIPAVSASYIVRYIPAQTYATDVAGTLDLPIGHERRIVYGMARHAMIKDVSRSALLDQHIREADEEIGLSAFSRSFQESPRVRKVAPRLNAGVDMYGKFPTDPSTWFYP
jgi:hypothetical protein